MKVKKLISNAINGSEYPDCMHHKLQVMMFSRNVSYMAFLSFNNNNKHHPHHTHRHHSY